MPDKVDKAEDLYTLFTNVIRGLDKDREPDATTIRAITSIRYFVADRNKENTYTVVLETRRDTTDLLMIMLLISGLRHSPSMCPPPSLSPHLGSGQTPSVFPLDA